MEGFIVNLIGMKSVLIIGLIAIVPKVLNARSAGATELTVVHVHRHLFWRAGPQDCFLMPDVVVAVEALGPYCSSPRAYYPGSCTAGDRW